jgi:Spy/CpxP family protein refolding chaperone
MLKGIFSGMSTWVKILFLASLAFNLAIIGTFAGHRLGFWHGKHHHGMHRYIVSTMPADKRDRVEKILSTYKAAHPRRSRKLLARWDKFDSQLRAETFDRAAFIDTFKQEIEKNNQRLLDGGNVIADIAELLTPSERAAVLDKIKKKLERRRKHKHRH